MQIGCILIGDWRNTKKVLTYLILLLNTKQKHFEFQIYSLPSNLDLNPEAKKLLKDLENTQSISLSKDVLNHYLEDIANAIYNHSVNVCTMFSEREIPLKYILISPSKHIDDHFFQIDGTNGEGREEGNECRGAIILSGHHKQSLAPPSVVEFTFKFLMRISIKWMYPDFSRKARHWGQKGCLFDYVDSPDLIRYMILHNYICENCTSYIGESVKEDVLHALDSAHLYGSDIERHPAKISSKLGFNLTLSKGLYQTKYERIIEKLGNSFYERLGSLFACGLLFGFAVMFQFDTEFVNED